MVLQTIKTHSVEQHALVHRRQRGGSLRVVRHLDEGVGVMLALQSKRVNFFYSPSPSIANKPTTKFLRYTIAASAAQKVEE